MGADPTSSAWKADVLAGKLYLHIVRFNGLLSPDYSLGCFWSDQFFSMQAPAIVSIVDTCNFYAELKSTFIEGPILSHLNGFPEDP